MSFKEAIPFVNNNSGTSGISVHNDMDERFIFNYQNLENFIYLFLKNKFQNIQNDLVIRELQYFSTFYLINNCKEISEFDVSNTDLVKDLWLKFKTQIETNIKNNNLKNNSTYILF